MKNPGERIGKYEIESLIGSGGNGAVYRARDTMLGRPVALKLLHAKYHHDASIAARFKGEAEAMARLSHPNVVSVFDFVGQGNEWAIVMELCEGGETLEALIARSGRLPVRKAMSVAADACRGLAHAHGRGIIHRDVKPANVILVPDSEDGEKVKVTDFGIARLLGAKRHTREDLTLGTVYYMAPEQAESSSVDARADVYALGATLYHMLTGTVPFPGDNAIAVLAAHASESPVPPSARAPGIPPELDALVLGCLAKDPADRPDDAAALGAALREIAGRPSAEELAATAPSLPPQTSDGPEARPPPPSPEVAAESENARDTRTGLWIGVGVVLLLGTVCMVGGALACVTCQG